MKPVAVDSLHTYLGYTEQSQNCIPIPVFVLQSPCFLYVTKQVYNKYLDDMYIEMNMYSPFHDSLPLSSVQVHQKKVKYYETGCSQIRNNCQFCRLGSPSKKNLHCPASKKNASFFFSKIKKKCLECSETKECAKIFCDVFAHQFKTKIFSLNIRNFLGIFSLKPKFFFFFKIIHFRLFLFQQHIHMYISIHAQKRKTCINRQHGGGGQCLRGRMQVFFTCSPQSK